MAVLIIVGLHFLPMGLALGWEASALGFICVTIAALGLTFSSLSFPLLVALDASFKMAVGGWFVWNGAARYSNRELPLAAPAGLLHAKWSKFTY